MTPKQIGRYKILTVLGRGAMGEVYRAHDPQLNREVALKLITPPDSASSNEWRQRFRREVQAAGQLNHPHIVTVHDVDLDHEPPYVVMELLLGGTLTEHLQQKPLSWQESLILLHPLAQALAYAHQAGVIHRDVKPANVMFTSDGILKLVDFGLARWQDGEQVTQTGTLIGTPAYMSPEQANEEIVDARTDIFALGIILLEAITGHNPLDQGSLASTIAELLSDRPIDLTSLEGRAPQIVIRLIERAVAKQREQRYPTAEALLTDLVRCLDDQDVASIAPPSTASPPEGPTIHKSDQIRLTPEVEAVLRTMFSSYGWLEIEAEFGSGLGGCRVFRVRPVEAGGKVHLPTAVKIGSIALIHQEWQAYQTWVKDTLPEIAQLESPPTFRPGNLWGGLRYALVGGGTFAVQSLRDYSHQASADDLTWVLKKRLFKIMGDSWWRVHRTTRIQLQAEYDSLLPVNLLISLTDSPPTGDSYLIIEPGNLPPPHLATGDYVHLRGFVVTEVDRAQKQLTLNLPPASAGRPPTSYRLHLQDVPDIDRYQVNHVLDSIDGVVKATRHDLLVEQVGQAMAGVVDLSAERLVLPNGLSPRGEGSLPNPLLAYPALLNTFLTVHTSTIHGDLNLENILVDPDTRQPRLIDFATVRQGHVLHDLLHLETEIVTKLIPPALAEAGLEPEAIYTVYQQLHEATFYPGQVAAPITPLHPSLEKPFRMLVAIREMARECLFSSADWTEYYSGLSLCLLGVLKFKALDNLPDAPWPKQVAFWGAATSMDLQAMSRGDETMITQPTRLFISYKQHIDPDQKLASYLYEFLTTQGHEVFIDRTLRAGEEWLERVDQQIKASEFLVVLLSKESAHSEMVQAEIRRAYEYRHLQGKPHTLPVRMAYEELLPYSIDFFLDPLQYVLWQSEADNERVGHDILAAIEGRLPQQPPLQTKPLSGGVIVSEDGQLVADEETLPPPLPEFDPRFLEALQAPGGAVKLRDKFYIEREADMLLKHEVVQLGAIITIRAPYQTGKSSLLIRGMHHAQENGAKVVSLDLQRVDSSLLETPDLFLRYLAEFIVRRLRLDVAEVEKAWRGSLGPQDKLTFLLEDYVLSKSEAPIVLALDEVDRMLQTPFYSEFFNLLRSWHNVVAYDERWDKFNIVMVISTEPYLLITDSTIQSPFNVGLKLYLEDFDETQVGDLNQRHGSPVSADDFLQFMEWLNGHPYLTRKALYTMVTEQLTWTEMTRIAVTDQGPFGDHLRHQQWLLHDQPALREAMKQVIHQKRCSDEMALFRLLRAGLVKGSGEVHTCRCELYRMYFKDKL